MGNSWKFEIHKFAVNRWWSPTKTPLQRGSVREVRNSRSRRDGVVDRDRKGTISSSCCSMSHMAWVDWYQCSGYTAGIWNRWKLSLGHHWGRNGGARGGSPNRLHFRLSLSRHFGFLQFLGLNGGGRGSLGPPVRAGSGSLGQRSSLWNGNVLNLFIAAGYPINVQLVILPSLSVKRVEQTE